jgi:hypothetical protein
VTKNSRRMVKVPFGRYISLGIKNAIGDISKGK